MQVTDVEINSNELLAMLTSKDRLVKNKLLSGDFQGVAQLISGIAAKLAREAAAERSAAGLKEGDVLRKSAAQNTRIQVVITELF